MNTNYKGGFSQGVNDSYQFQEYIKGGHPCGYIGSSERTDKRDAIVESVLRARDLGDAGIAVWLTSGSGRHLMDNPGKTLKAFKERVEEYTQEAFFDVLVWSHPDHQGSVGSSILLKELVFSHVKSRLGVLK